MKKTAFLSYNAIPGFTAGWVEKNGRSALVIPNSKGQSFAATFSGAEGNQTVHNEIENLWSKLNESISEIDHVVIYVGTSGSENAIKLASSLEPSKVTYVLCDCGLGHKRSLIAEAGHKDAQEILCECRGMETMSSLCKNFLNAGLIG